MSRPWHEKRKAELAAARAGRLCANCRCMFDADSSKAVYCSRVCNLQAFRLRERPELGLRQLHRARGRLLKQLRSVLQCKVRDARDAVRAAAQARRPAALACSGCGTLFSWLSLRTRSDTCPPCAEERAKARHRASRLLHKTIRRARMKASDTKRFDPVEVFERDGWRCRLCGTHTLKALRGTPHADAPELDHWCPLASGGEHSTANCRCLCRTCNGEKAALFPFDGLTSRAVAAMGLRRPADIPDTARQALAHLLSESPV